MWDKERNMKLDQGKHTNMSSFNRGSAFNVAAQGVRHGSNSLVDWLKNEPKSGLHYISMEGKESKSLGRLECSNVFVI